MPQLGRVGRGDVARHGAQQGDAVLGRRDRVGRRRVDDQAAVLQGRRYGGAGGTGLGGARSEEKVVKDAGKKIKGSKKTASGEEKKKRAPSVFNLYVKDVMPDMKAKHPDIKDGKQMIGFASESWKTDPMATFIKEKVLEMKADEKDGDVVEMYAKAKAMYKAENGDSQSSTVVKAKASKKEKTDDESDEKQNDKPKAKKATKKEKTDDESDEKEKSKTKKTTKKVVKEDEEDEE